MAMMSSPCLKEFPEFLSKLKECASLSEDVYEELKNWSDTIFNVTKIPILKKADDIPYNEDDFLDTSRYSAGNLILQEQFVRVVLGLVRRSPNPLPHSTRVIICVHSIVLGAQYQDSSTDWSCRAASNTAQAILTLLIVPNGDGITGLEILEGKECSQFSLESVNSSQHKTRSVRLGSTLKPLLQHLSDNFTKALWKNDPGSREFYLWLVDALSPSELSEQLGYLLPGALLLLDDWEQRHKISALHVLLHVLSTIPGSELRLYGRAAVIHEAAKHNLYSREPCLLEAAYPVAVRAAAVLHDQPGDNTTDNGQLSAPEEILSLLLREMCHEQRLDLRRVYAACLPAALTAVGLAAVRWSHELLEVFRIYLTTHEDQHARDRILMLQCVQCYLKQGRAQAGRLAEPILQALLQLLYQLATEEGHVTDQALQQLLDEGRTVVTLLQVCRPSHDRALYRGLGTLPLPPPVRNNVNAVFGEVMDVQLENGGEPVPED